jgi:alcohol dehydrogenase class IV
MDFNMVADVPKFAQLAGLMGVDPAGLSVKEQALKGIQAVRDLIADVGLTMRMRDYGVQKEAIPEMVNTVFTNSLNLINLNCRKINRPEVTGIFEAAW